MKQLTQILRSIKIFSDKIFCSWDHLWCGSNSLNFEDVSNSTKCQSVKCKRCGKIFSYYEMYDCWA